MPQLDSHGRSASCQSPVGESPAPTPIAGRERRLKLRPFSLQRFGRGAFAVYTLKGGYISEDMHLFELLSSLRGRVAAPLTKSEIVHLLHHPLLPGQLLFRLLQTKVGLFQSASVAVDSFRGIVLISDVPEALENMAASLREEVHFPIEILDIKHVGSDVSSHLVVAYLESYRASLVRSLHARYGSANSENLILISYIDRRNFLIDNLYSSVHGTPCHFCRRAWMDEDTAGLESHNSDPWMGFMSQMAATENDISPSLPISAVERGFLLFHLYRTVRDLVSSFASPLTHDRAMAAARIFIRTGEMRTSTIPHHPGCDCL
jgi:McbB family protein